MKINFDQPELSYRDEDRGGTTLRIGFQVEGNQNPYHFRLNFPKGLSCFYNGNVEMFLKDTIKPVVRLFVRIFESNFENNTVSDISGANKFSFIRCLPNWINDFGGFERQIKEISERAPITKIGIELPHEKKETNDFEGEIKKWLKNNE